MSAIEIGKMTGLSRDTVNNVMRLGPLVSEGIRANALEVASIRALIDAGCSAKEARVIANFWFGHMDSPPSSWAFNASQPFCFGTTPAGVPMERSDSIAGVMAALADDDNHEFTEELAPVREPVSVAFINVAEINKRIKGEEQ
ncbi:hypothetical protein [Roseovarius sp.]|uniref:hypothetical protein n=1 Tax=Roseovarius sp. TaxID=1486281 RepID=UPI003BAA2FA8